MHSSRRLVHLGAVWNDQLIEIQIRPVFFYEKGGGGETLRLVDSTQTSNVCLTCCYWWTPPPPHHHPPHLSTSTPRRCSHWSSSTEKIINLGDSAKSVIVDEFHAVFHILHSPPPCYHPLLSSSFHQSWPPPPDPPWGFHIGRARSKPFTKRRCFHFVLIRHNCLPTLYLQSMMSSMALMAK